MHNSPFSINLSRPVDIRWYYIAIIVFLRPATDIKEYYRTSSPYFFLKNICSHKISFSLNKSLQISVTQPIQPNYC